MAPSPLSLRGNSSLKGGNQPSGAAYAGATTHPGESFKLSGSKMATNAIKMKVSVPFTTNDKVNPIPALTMILKASKYLDAHSHIKSNDPMFADIINVNDVAKITDIDKFVSDLQTNVHKKQFVWFFTLDTTISFSNLKYNKQLFSWMREHQHFLSTHSMKMNYVSPIGFLSGLHPTLSSHDAMKVLLDGPLQDLEFSLVTTSQFFITQKEKKVNTTVVEIHVAADEAEHAREQLSIAWEDAVFLPELKAHAVGMPIMFIPMIKHGIMNVVTFREALRQQHEFAINTIGMSIEGVAGLEVEIKHNGKKVTLAKMILNLKDDKGKALFSSIEQTKFTNEYGCYLVLTQKNVIDVAEAKFDELLLHLANEGKLDAFCIEGTFIHRHNQVQSCPLASYAKKLKAQFQPPVATVDVEPRRAVTTPTRNTWHRTPTFKKGQDNIPKIATPSRHHTLKKQHTKAGSNNTVEDDSSLSPTSLGTTQTELTDERTEMQTTIVNMQSTFSAELKKIKAQNEQNNKKVASRIEKSEQEFQKAQEAILAEFTRTEEQYTQVLESFAKLGEEVCAAKIEMDQRMYSMMEVLLNINQSLAIGKALQALTQDQVNHIMQSPRDGVPGSSPTTTKSSPADLNGGSRGL
jgi:hypothetical protein